MMEEHLDKLCRYSGTNGSDSFNIVGSFWIRNHCYLVVHKDSIKNPTKSDLTSSPCFSPNLEVAHFEVGGQHFAVVEAENLQSSTKSNITEILTEREIQIVRLVAQGHQNKQIARQLHISEWTVSTHIRRIFTKLGVDSRAAMVYQCAFFIWTDPL